MKWVGLKRGTLQRGVFFLLARRQQTDLQVDPALKWVVATAFLRVTWSGSRTTMDCHFW